MTIPDKAVEAATQAYMDTRFAGIGFIPTARSSEGMRAALEAAEPYLREQVAEEIAVALETRAVEWETPTPTPEGWDSHHLIVRGASQAATRRAAGVAREIGGLS